MKRELQEALVRDFPVLCQGVGGDMRQTCMAWGFDCGDGWEPLIRRAMEKIDAARINNPDAGKLAQVKEKFGTLRIYLERGTDEMWDAANEAEQDSANVCESCGIRDGVTTEGGWIKTLCGKCRATRLPDPPATIPAKENCP